MLTDGVAQPVSVRDPAAPVEVTDVAEVLLRSVRRAVPAAANETAPAGVPAIDPSGGTTP